MQKRLFIDTHSFQSFGIGLYKEKYDYIIGTDASKNLLVSFKKLDNEEIKTNEIDEIIIINGPGSLTGLRIGSSTALGIALGLQTRIGKEIPIKSLNVWDILLNEHKDLTIFFYTGTKKWIIKTKEDEIISENIEDIRHVQWMSNNVEKTKLSPSNNIRYPNLIELMPKYASLASDNIDLLYPVTVFQTTSSINLAAKL